MQTLQTAYKQMTELMQTISALPVAERLRLVEQIMESIDESAEPLPVQDWHREEIRSRIAGCDDSEYITADELWRRIRDT